jgi:hypothetical protein
MIVDFHLAKHNGVFEFQSFLEQDDLGSKLSFDLNLELPWGHFNRCTCLVPFLLPLPTFLVLVIFFYKMDYISLMEIKIKLT